MKNLFLFLILIIFSFPSIAQKKVRNLSNFIWTIQEKQLLIDNLEKARQNLFEEVQNLNSAQWNFKEDSARWSVAEVIEHLFAQNEKYRIEMGTILTQPPSQEFLNFTNGNDNIFINYVNDQLKGDAGFLSPIGRFCSKERAIFAFNRTYDVLINIIKTSDKDFRKHFTFRNYVFDGGLTDAEKYNIRDAHQLMLTCIAHMERHTNQIRKIKNHPDFSN
jgi:hypothetical protein